MKSLLIILYISLGLTILYSCKKQDDIGSGYSKLKISVSIKDDYEKKVSSTDVISDQQVHPIRDGKLTPISKELDALVSIDTTNSFIKRGFNKKRDTNAKLGELMADGIKFRLIIYETTIATPEYNQIVESGVDPEIGLPSGKTYNWVAVSTNETSFAPTVTTDGKVEKDQILNKDFLFAQGVLNLAEKGENFLNIAFTHKMARVQVHLQTRGLFGSIENDSEFEILNDTDNNIVQIGDFDIDDQQFHNLTTEAITILGSETVIAPSLQYGNGDLYDYEAYKEVYVGKESVYVNLYTTQFGENIEADNLRFKLKSLAIKMDDDSRREFTPNTTLELTHDSFTLQSGKSTLVNVILVETGIEIGSSIWARTNIIFKENYPGVKEVRLTPNIDYANPDAVNEYFRDDFLDPLNYGGFDLVSKPGAYDICTAVFPYLIGWRGPTQSEYEELEAYLVPQVTKINNTPRYSYVWINPSPPSSSPYPNHDFILPLFGIRTGHNPLSPIIEYHGKDVDYEDIPSPTPLIRGEYMTNEYFNSSPIVVPIIRFQAEYNPANANEDDPIDRFTWTKEFLGGDGETQANYFSLENGRMQRCLRIR